MEEKEREGFLRRVPRGFSSSILSYDTTVINEQYGDYEDTAEDTRWALGGTKKGARASDKLLRKVDNF